MAKIKIIDSSKYPSPQYTAGDEAAILPTPVNSTFTTNYGRAEAIVFDLDGNALNYNSNAQFAIIENGVGKDRSTADAIEVYPGKEVENLGFDIGSYNVFYNFLNNELKSSADHPFTIKQISADRTEVRLVSNFLSREELKQEVAKIFPEQIVSPYYPDFVLNFGKNRLAIATNLLFDETNNQYSVLVKLYEPLPSYASERDATWVATRQRDSVAYNVELETPIYTPDPIQSVLKGPNFSLSINNQTHTDVKPTNLEQLQNLSGITTASRLELDSILEEKGITVNVDYHEFSNFIHFSSAEQRIQNFYDKVSLIESWSAQIDDAPDGSGTYLSASRAIIEDKISTTIKNFDGFEYWMYYTSESIGSPAMKPYPKSTSSKPYTLASTSSGDALSWLSDSLTSASIFDAQNQDYLVNTIPSYLSEDSENEPYIKFVEMIGHHFDNLYVYVQDITNRYNGDNRLDFGISKDLVGEAIRSMGINLYSGNFTAYDLVDSFIGNSNPSVLPDGQQGVSNYVTATDEPIPVEDVNKEIYKRLYHNLPLLLKKKGSIAGLRTLVTCFGIPEEILKIREFNIKGESEIYDIPAAEAEATIDFVTKSVSLPPDRSDYIPPTFLSPSVRVQQHYVKSESYDRSLQYIEVGYSPSNFLDESDSFDPLDTSFPDYGDFYFGDSPYYYGSKFIADYASSGQNTEWTTNALIRFVKMFDSSLFQMIKDFVPVRSSTATGVIIKPTLRERQRNRPAQLEVHNLIYSGSGETLDYLPNGPGGEYYFAPVGDVDKRKDFARIGSGDASSGVASYDGSYRHIGGTGGSFENLNKYSFNTETDEKDFTQHDTPTPIDSDTAQVWTEKMFVIKGYAQQTESIQDATNNYYTITHAAQDEFYNGIFKQTGIGNLEDYLNRELPSASVQDGTGVFRYDNNRFNPYKKPTSYTYAGLGLDVFSGGLPYFLTTLSAAIGYTINYDNAFIYMKIAGSITQELLNGNGSTLTFTNSGGTNFLFNVGTPIYVANASAVTYAIFPALDGMPADGNEGGWLAQDGQTLTFVANWDPEEEDQNAGPWAYNEYNPLINNSFDPQAGLVNYNGIRKSVLYQDADYSPSASSSLNPINVDLLVSGSASRAAVQDSYYASDWWSNSRYGGVKRSSPDFNVPVLKTTQNITGIYTSQSLGFDPFTSQSLPDQPALPRDR